MQDVTCDVCGGDGWLSMGEGVRGVARCPECGGAGVRPPVEPPPITSYDRSTWPKLDGPAMVRGVPQQVYHAHPYISASAYKAALRSVGHYKHHRLMTGAGQGHKLSPGYERAALDLGTAAHIATFEPDTFAARVEVKLDGRTDAGKAQRLAPGQRLLITAEDYDAARRIGDAVRAHPWVSDHLAFPDAERELSILTGAGERVRPDWWSAQAGVILDLKTTTDARADAFARSVVHWGYHLQAALYAEAIQDLTGAAPVFLFVAVEKAAPYAVAVYALGGALEIMGRDALSRARHVASLARGGDDDGFPSYERGVTVLNPPR